MRRRILLRVYRMGLLPGLLLSLPPLLVVCWYAWSAFAQLDRYRRAGSGAVLIDAELFHIALFDELHRDLRRMTVGQRPLDSQIPVYALSVTRDGLDALTEQLYSDKARGYVNGYVRKDGEIHEIGIRYRGGQPWHWLGPQKSLKLRVERGELLDGSRIFNLLNDPTPFGLEEQIILDVARDLGLLTPEYHPAWVRINNSDMGVYRYEAQPVEDLLRRGHRIPGSIYSGDTEATDQTMHVGALFFSRDGWQKVASRSQETRGDFGELERLLYAVRSASFLEFADYAHQEIALDRYAAFDALDVVFGGNDHDYFSNQKLYFDPYRGKHEPVVWSFRGFQHEPVFNLVDHPLLVRLKEVPGYLASRNRTVYELLTGKASVSEVKRRADQMFGQMLPDLAADPYWDAYKLLPRVTRFHRFMPRPMSEGRWLLAAQAELVGFARRSRFLLDALERPGVAVGWTAGQGAPGRIDVTVDGQSAYRLQEITVVAPCAGTFALYADVDRDARLSSADREVARGALGSSSPVAAYAELLPGIVLAARPDPDAKHGRVRAEPEARRYSFLLSTTGCSPAETTLVINDEVTGGSSRMTVSGTAPPAPSDLPPASEVPRLEVGQRSPHLWDFPPEPEPREIHLGPGEVTITSTRVFAPHESVVIAAGTILKLGPEVTLVFSGPVRAEGTVSKPIVIARADSSRPFGGVALQGPGTAGSRLAHVRIEGGGRARHGSVEYTGLLNIHDTADVTLEGLTVNGDTGSDDVVHAAYVRDLRLHELTVQDAPTDAVDLEFCSGEIRGLRALSAGDDCLDLMGTSLLLSDSVLAGCTNNAVSAGEETEVTAHGVLIADSKVGILSKDASHVRIARSLVYRSGTALVAKHREFQYAGTSSIGADDLFAIDCQKVDDATRDAAIDKGRLQMVFPGDDSLDHLRRVLGLSNWQEMDRFVAGLRETRSP